MASFRIPRLVGKTNMAGLTTWYWQPSKTLRARGWAPRRLGAGQGEDPPDEIVAEARALNAKVDGGGEVTRAIIRRIQRPVTLGEGIARFRAADYPSVRKPGERVAAATARQYRSKLKRLEDWGGDVALASIAPARVAVLRKALMEPAKSGRWAGNVRHHAAHETLRVGRTLFAWFEQEGLTPRGANPFAAFGLAAPAPRQQIWWEPAREAILAAAGDEANGGDAGMALAIDLAFSIGQREADLLRLTIAQYVEIPAYKMDPDVFAALAADHPERRVFGIRLRQAKGKRWIEVPIVGATRRRVEAAIARSRALGFINILHDARNGKPWGMPSLAQGQRRFIRRFAEIRDTAIAAALEAGQAELAAELAELQYRDFRRTAVVFLGELGIPDHLIAAITGHSLDDTKKILETYMPLTTGMAARAISLSMSRAPSRAEEKKA